MSIKMFFTTIFSVMIVLMLVATVFKLWQNDWQFMDLWQNGVIPVMCGIILAVTVIGGLIGWGIGHSSMFYNEIWHCKIIGIRHEMLWTTEETEYYKVKVGERRVLRSDGKGYTTEAIYEQRHKHYTAKHGPYFYAIDEYGSSSSINEGTYEKWKGIWRNESQTGIHHGSSASMDRSIDGPIFECKWTNEFNTIYPMSSIHTYKNKVRASKNSVLKLSKPTPELKKKYPRPADNDNDSPVFVNGANVSFDANDRLLLDRVNAYLGRSFEIHCMFQLFNAKEHGMDIVTEMLTAWEGTNKNELVIFMGIDPDAKTISWIKSESWMDNTELYGYLDSALLNKPFSTKLCADTLMDNVPKYWKRKHFADFDYLRIELPGFVLYSVIVAQLIASVATFILVDKMLKY